MTKSEHIVRGRKLADGSWVQIHEDGSETPLETRKSDWERAIGFSQDDANYNALLDPDNEPFLTEADRAQIEALPEAKRVRHRLGLTQREFSDRFQIPLGTLRDWERGARSPDAAARHLLRLIDVAPDFVSDMLEEPAVESAEERRSKVA